MKTKLSVAVITAILLLSAILLLLPSSVSAASITSSPITINGDLNLAAQASVNNWSGNGSASNPYIISNLNIDAEGGPAAIGISGTTLHVTIENCVLSDARNGVYIDDATNVTVRDNDFSTQYGVFLWGRIAIP